MMHHIAATAALGLLLLAGPVVAQVQHQGGGTNAPGPAEEPVSERARARYPQAVRVGDLAGRQVLEDSPQQRVLARVVGVTRDAGGQVSVLVDCCGVLGFGARRVALPVETMTLLGQFIVVRDHDRAALRALPEATSSPDGLLPAGAEIQVGLGRN